MDDSFETFAGAELPGLLRYAVMLTGDRELARDLVQDVMVKAYDKWDRVSAADHPRLYVRTMITRAHLSWRRRWAVRNVLVGADDDFEATVDRHTSTADHAGALAEREDLWQRMSGLPRQQRAVLVLRFYEHLTDAEIADVLGCSAGTVRGYASRALATLRVDLTPELAPAEPHREQR